MRTCPMCVYGKELCIIQLAQHTQVDENIAPDNANKNISGTVPQKVNSSESEGKSLLDGF